MQIDSVRVMARTLQRRDPEWRTSSYKAADMGGAYVAIEAGGQTGVGGTASHPFRITAEDLTKQLTEIVVPALTHQPLERARRILGGLSGSLAARTYIAVDLALHDLTGRLAGLPAEVLWGGPVRDTINVIRFVGIKEPEKTVAAARPLYESGVRAFKLKIGDGVDRDVARVRNIREEFGVDVTVAVDANGAYDVDSAMDLCRRLGDLNVHCVEQPVAYRDVEGMAAVRAKSPVPVMADQTVESVADAIQVARAGAADMVSLKLTKMGSVEECVRVSQVCTAEGLGVHLGGCAGPGMVDSAITRLALSIASIDSFAEVGESSAVVADDHTPGVLFEGKHALSDGKPGLGGVPPVF